MKSALLKFGLRQELDPVIKFCLVLIASLALSAGALGQQAKQPAAKCSALTELKLEHTTIESAQLVPAGAYHPAAESNIGPRDSALYKRTPAFCRVSVVSRPSSDSDIRIEVWLPAAAWNGRYRGQGNGGFAGEISYDGLAASVLQGYASAGTDTGHSASGIDASWALGHPEKVADYGYRGIHEMTTAAKAIIHAYYGSAPTRSYFGACSDGGREALMEAQRYPDDYDGILAGAPANYWTNLLANSVVNSQALTLDPATYLPPSKVEVIAAAVNAACDSQDGVKDGVINDPRQCRFDPSTLLCKDSNSTACLTQPQITALKQLYAGAHDSSGREVFPGYLPGAEEGSGGWTPWITGPEPGKSLMFAFGGGYFSNMVFDKSGWDYRGFQLDRDLAVAQSRTAHSLNSNDPDLKPFEQRGGKLILYHGWNDPAISALNTIHYYESVAAKLGATEEESFVRLYMVPGMQHCNSGPGPIFFDQFGSGPKLDAAHDMYTALEEWVEKGTAPSSVTATKFVKDDPTLGVELTRPLCVYPQVLHYRGSGDSKDAASFECVAKAE